jgi:hypothetical protein
MSKKCISLSPELFGFILCGKIWIIVRRSVLKALMD